MTHGPSNGRLRWGLSLALAAALLGVTSPRPALAASLVVDKEADDTGGLCTGAASDCSLRSAVDIANTNGVTDTITFAANYTITLGSGLALSASGTTIRATPSQVIEVNANNGASAFHITGSDSTLEGLRIYGSGVAAPNVFIASPAQRVRLAYNVIGDDDPGFIGACDNSPNSYAGVYISSNAVPAGADALAWIYGNDIKCIGGLPGHGIHIVASREVVIGADSAGNAGSVQRNFVQDNNGSGVRLTTNANVNIIRNSALQYNDGNGLEIDGSDSNWVYGVHFQNNEGDGVNISDGSQSNTIGCGLFTADPEDEDQRNVVHNNSGDGIRITGAGTDSNLVWCNWIGLSDDGQSAGPNGEYGVRIESGAQGNAIGTGSTTRNVISGNDQSGVLIIGSGTRNNLVQGNYIGTNVSGNGVVGNGVDGVTLGGGATQNTIGGSSLANLNVIGGNAWYGIYIYGSTTTTNTVRNNDVGLNTALGNLPLPNLVGGVRLTVGTHGNSLGGPSWLNFVAFNGGDGISVAEGAYANTFSDNRVFSNTQSGVSLDGAGTTDNLFSQFHSFGNGQDGIAERNGATQNFWTEISTYGNGGLGIDKSATVSSTDTPTLPYPIITSVNLGTGEIEGTATAGAAVELYRVAPDPSGFGEGRAYVATASASVAGEWSLLVKLGEFDCFTAFQTSGGSSSEFGPHTCPYLYLPLIMK